MKAALIIIMCLIGTTAIAQTRYYYGPSGNYEGNTQQVGPNGKYFYGSDGSYQGMAQKNGNFTNYYGADGSYLGNSMEMRGNNNE